MNKIFVELNWWTEFALGSLLLIGMLGLIAMLIWTQMSCGSRRALLRRLSVRFTFAWTAMLVLAITTNITGAWVGSQGSGLAAEIAELIAGRGLALAATVLVTIRLTRLLASELRTQMRHA